MKKTIALLLVSLFGATSLYAAETFFKTDFSNGLEDFVTYNVDGASPNSNAKSYGFDENSSWIHLTYEKEDVAASNSTHQQGKRADDWLVTPAIEIVEGAVLSFDTKTVCYDGSVVRIADVGVKISTTGNAVADFTTDLATDVQADGDWKPVVCDLAEYVGKTVYIAIVNNNRTKDLLLVDNFMVGVEVPAMVELQYTKLQTNLSQGQAITATVEAGVSTTITSLEATLTCGEFTSTVSLADLNVAPYGTQSITFPDALPAPTAGEPQQFEVVVVVNGSEEIVAEGEIVSQAYQPAKRVVVEEHTGTWCQACPAGHVYMEMMAEKYPDTFIGVAVHQNDPMQYYDYLTLTYYDPNGMGTSFPNTRANRLASAMAHPVDIEEMYKSVIGRHAVADIALKAEWLDYTTRTLKLTATTTFALSATDFDVRLEYLVLENDVNVPDNARYNQLNAYSGGTAGEMGGYENLANPVPASQMYYQDVVRHAVADKIGLGIKGSIPAIIEKGVAYEHSVEVTLPESVLLPLNCELVVMLIDYKTGEIYNAATCIPNAPEAVNKIANDTHTVYAIDGGVRVETNVQGMIEVKLFTTDGRLVYTAAPRIVAGAATIDCPVEGKGVYLVNVVCDQSIETYKVVL